MLYLPHEILPNLVGADLGQWCMDDVSLNNEPLGNHMTRWANHADVNYSGRLSDVLAIGLHYDGVQYTSIIMSARDSTKMSARDSTKKAVRIPLFVAKKASSSLHFLWRDRCENPNNGGFRGTNRLCWG